ncbi:electron carrier [Pestalotiopsis sp. IQ-011]
MSIRIALDNPPEFYTNLDFIQGRIILGLNRPESIGNIVVKLEGDSRTALDVDDRAVTSFSNSQFPSDYRSETHKLLYLVKQVYPDERSQPSTPVGGMPGVLYPGQHEFPFKFKVPLNNICGNPTAMAAFNGIGGIAGPSSNFLGFAGFRTMDGSKQLMLQHVRATLPPSLTGFPRKAEIRYYIKCTIQRPGFFKENWRYQIGFKFLPIESPRPPVTKQEAFARRPFTFQPRTPHQAMKKRTSFFGSKNTKNDDEEPIPPSFEMSARLPFPSILTCNQPIPLRLVAKKVAPSQEQVYLTSLEICLVGFTDIRVFDTQHSEVTKWVVASGTNLAIPVGDAADAVDTETVLPDRFWAERPLPNTVAPTFTACNLSRRYEIELRITLSWGKPAKIGSRAAAPYPQNVTLPLKLSKVDIFSGITPPPELVQAAAAAITATNNGGRPQPPPLPPRTPTASGPPHDPLYPPQLAPGELPRYDDAPPSYDEAVAQQIPGPQERPAYSGVTAENDPSTMPPEKSGHH